MSLTDTVDQEVGIVEQSPENGHRMKQTQQRIKGTLKLKKQEMKFKDTESGKNQAESHDPCLRAKKAKGKVKAEALTTQFYSFPLHVFTTSLKK